MPVSEAKKKANARWNASKDNIMIRPTKEEGTAIRAAAAAAGQSNQQYILQATRERMERDGAGGPQQAAGAPTGAGGISLPPGVLESAQRAAGRTGEAVWDFLARAAQSQAKRDEISLHMGLNPATGDKLNSKGGADHE